MHGQAKALSGDCGPAEARLRMRVDRIRAKDADALSELYDETSSRLYSLAVHILSDRADAEEIVLDVYQHVWRSAHSFDSKRGTVWGWLAILTRSRAIDRLRAAGTRRDRQVSALEGIEVRSGSPGPEIQSIDQHQREIVTRALQDLSTGERSAIELAYFRGLTHIEIAERLGQPVGTIKTRLRSGIRKLRDAVEPIIRA